MTTHYSAADVGALIEASERVANWSRAESEYGDAKDLRACDNHGNREFSEAHGVSLDQTWLTAA